MKLTFIGVSSALSVGYLKFHSNILIESNNHKNILVDCGGDARHALHELGLKHNNIDAVYISHLHADHVGGLEWLGFSKFFNEKTRLPLYIANELSHPLWDNVLSGGMKTLEEKEATLDTFFNVIKHDNTNFKWENILFELVKVPHTYSNSHLLPSYGLLIYTNNKTIFITTDTRFNPEVLMNVYKKADIIFHDCETSTHASHQHARYDQLIGLPTDIKNKMWLYGYNNNCLPNAINDGFLGFATRGQQFEF